MDFSYVTTGACGNLATCIVTGDLCALSYMHAETREVVFCVISITLIAGSDSRLVVALARGVFSFSFLKYFLFLPPLGLTELRDMHEPDGYGSSVEDEAVHGPRRSSSVVVPLCPQNGESAQHGFCGRRQK